MTVLARPEVVLGGRTDDLDRALDRASSKMQGVGKSMQRIGRRLSTTVTLPLVGIGAAALKTSADFESSMNRVQGLTGATGKEFETLSDQAQELGRTTQFSASQAADAMGFLGMAGFETTEILATMPNVLNLAAAAQMDLGRTADIVSNILTGYGLEVDQLGRANDVLVKTTTSANVNLSQMGEALQTVGPIASNVGIDFEEVAAALGVMGDAGVQGSEAGTALRIGLGRLLNPTKDVTDALASLGLSMDDVNPTANTLTEIIGALEQSGAEAGDILRIFGQRGAAIAPLIAQGAGAVEDLEAKLRESGGAAQEMADVQMRGLSGALRELRSATEGLFIAISESGLLAAFTGLVQRVTSLFQSAAELNPAVLATITAVAGLAAAIGPLSLAIGSVLAIMPTLTAGFTALVASGGPILLGVAAFGALVAAGLALIDNWGIIKFEVQQLVTKIKEWLGDKLEAVVGRVNGIVEGVSGAFEWLTDQVVGNSFVPDMVDGIEGEFKRMGGIADRGLDAIANFATGSDEALRGFVTSALKQLARLAVRMLAIKAIMSFLPGVGNFLGLEKFAGGFANGGRIPSGQFGVVGERGPEIVQGPANVTPMSEAGQSITINMAPPRNRFEQLAQQYWEESAKQAEHNGFRVNLGTT